MSSKKTKANFLDLVDNVILSGKESFDKYHKIYDWYAANKEYFVDDDFEIDIDEDKLFDNIISLKQSDKIATKLKYGILTELLTLQYIFYEQSDKVNDETLSIYRTMTCNAKNLYNSMFDGQKDLSCKFTVDVDLKDNISVSLAKIDTYANAFKTALKAFYHMMIVGGLTEGSGFMPFVIFHSNVADNEKKWRERISYWILCYLAYIDHYKDGMQKCEMRYNPIYQCNNTDDKVNSTTKITSYIKEAERLISSTEKGNFPY